MGIKRRRFLRLTAGGASIGVAAMTSGLSAFAGRAAEGLLPMTGDVIPISLQL